MAIVSIRSKKDDPYLVEGEVDLFDSEGNKVGIWSAPAERSGDGALATTYLGSEPC